MEEISRSPLLAESILRSRQIISSDKHFSFFFLNRTHPIRFSSPILSYLLDRYEIEITSIAGPFPPNQMTCTRVSRPKDKAPGIEESTAKRSLDWIAIEPRSPPSLQRYLYRAKKMCENNTGLRRGGRSWLSANRHRLSDCHDRGGGLLYVHYIFK